MSNEDLSARECDVRLTVYEARALRIASYFGGPPDDDRDPNLDRARVKLRDAEAAALSREEGSRG